jgi:hypothetical protein
MKGMKLIRVILFFLILPAFFSCNATKQAEKDAARKQAKLDKEGVKAYNQMVREHKSNQSKETLRMMKRTEAEAKKYNRYRER